MGNNNGDTKVSARQLADAAKEPYNTIDHWSGENLLSVSRKGRTRKYPLEENLKRCKQIRELQDRGYSLAAIREHFDKENKSSQ